MKLFNKLELYIDYNNLYTVKKALNILSREFDLAVKVNNRVYASEVIYTAKKLYDEIKSRESLQFFHNRARAFVGYLMHKSKSEFGTTTIKEDIIIDEG